MSHKHYRFLAMLPLMAVLGSSPDYLMKSRHASRSLAMEYEFPLYEAKTSSLKPEALYKDDGIDLTKFSEKADAYRTKLMDFRSAYQMKELAEEKVKAQNLKIDDLVIGMYLLERDFKSVKDRGLYAEPNRLDLGESSMRELKITLESLLVDQKENDTLILAEKTRKEEADALRKQEEEKKKKEELARQESEQKKCEELEAKYKTLTEQVETLVADNKKIMEQMMAMMQMMTGGFNPVYLPYLSGPQVVQQYQLPYSVQGTNGNWVYVPENTSQQTFQDYMKGTYQQEQQQRFNPTYFSGQQQFAPTAPQFSPIAPNFQPMNIETGNFGQSNETFNFGQTAHNVDFSRIFLGPI